MYAMPVTGSLSMVTVTGLLIFSSRLRLFGVSGIRHKPSISMGMLKSLWISQRIFPPLRFGLRPSQDASHSRYVRLCGTNRLHRMAGMLSPPWGRWSMLARRSMVCWLPHIKSPFQKKPGRISPPRLTGLSIQPSGRNASRIRVSNTAVLADPGGIRRRIGVVLGHLEPYGLRHAHFFHPADIFKLGVVAGGHRHGFGYRSLSVDDDGVEHTGSAVVAVIVPVVGRTNIAIGRGQDVAGRVPRQDRRAVIHHQDQISDLVKHLLEGEASDLLRERTRLDTGQTGSVRQILEVHRLPGRDGHDVLAVVHRLNLPQVGYVVVEDREETSVEAGGRGDARGRKGGHDLALVRGEGGVVYRLGSLRHVLDQDMPVPPQSAGGGRFHQVVGITLVRRLADIPAAPGFAPLCQEPVALVHGLFQDAVRDIPMRIEPEKLVLHAMPNIVGIGGEESGVC